jgi:hypothetical protein
VQTWYATEARAERLGRRLQASRSAAARLLEPTAIHAARIPCLVSFAVGGLQLRLANRERALRHRSSHTIVVGRPGRRLHPAPRRLRPGVWRSAERSRALRVVGALLIASAVIGLFWPPMHLRGTEPTLTDTLHIVFAVVWNLLAVLTIVFAAAALGAPFRLYSVVTLATFVVFGILTGMEAPRIATDLPTPWIGVWERVIIEAFYLWLTVLAVVVVQALDEATVPVLAEAQRGFRSLPLDQAAELCRDRNG